MTMATEYIYLFRDLDNPNRFYKVRASDSELATLRAFGKFGRRITSLSASELFQLRTESGFTPEIIEWKKE